MVSRNRWRDPRVIRKVVRTSKIDGRPKVARDRKAGVSMERIKARTARQCAAGCRRQNNDPSDLGMILPGDEYARVDVGMTRRMGQHMVPVTKDYHFECVPFEARFLVRFFKEGARP